MPNRPVRTMLEMIDERARALHALIEELLSEHSAIRVFRNDSGSGVVFVGFRNSWESLDQGGRRLQSQILRELDRYEPLVATLVHRSSESARRAVAEASKLLREAVDQSDGTWATEVEGVIASIETAFETQREHLASLYDPSAGETVYVPDANAVVWNPDLESWLFDGVPRFTLVLTSTLLGELDDLKMPHRGDALREKAESAIRRIKEYGRRGDIHIGVTLRGNRSAVRMTAVEPDFENTLPWLDRGVKDDRLLAAVLEVVRDHPHSAVILVTRDVNMQNKARHAGIPFVEPPDPQGKLRREKTPAKSDVRIVSFSDGDGSEDALSFRVGVQNFETRPVIADVRATLDGKPVQKVHPTGLNLLANAPPTTVSVHLPRPDLADKVRAFDGETTLYGATLEVMVEVEGSEVARRAWSEVVYSQEENFIRHEIQQQVWRIGRGEGTEADVRAEARRQRIERLEAR